MEGEVWPIRTPRHKSAKSAQLRWVSTPITLERNDLPTIANAVTTVLTADEVPRFRGGRNGQIEFDSYKANLSTPQSAVVRNLALLGSATLPDLIRESGVEDAARILKSVLRKFTWLKPYIAMPGRAYSGGYSTTIAIEWRSGVARIATPRGVSPLTKRYPIWAPLDRGVIR